MKSAKQNLPAELRGKLRTAVAAAASVFKIVRATAYFEKELGRLLQRLPGEPDLHLTLVVGDQELDDRKLNASEAADFAAISKTARKSSWLTGRGVLKELLHRCGLAEDTSQLRFPHANFSLTHSGTLAIAAHARLFHSCDQAAAYELAGTGIDYEAPRPINPQTTRFFLHQQEFGQLDVDSPEQLNQQELLRLWTIKEAIFKADPKNSGRFLGQYILEIPANHTGWAHHPDGTDLRFAYSSLNLDFGTITLALGLRSSRR